MAWRWGQHQQQQGPGQGSFSDAAARALAAAKEAQGQSATPPAVLAGPPQAATPVAPMAQTIGGPMGVQVGGPAGPAGPVGGLAGGVKLDPLTSQFNQAMADYQSTLAGTLGGIRAGEARSGRGMAALNALAGRSVGGAFAGGAAQTAIGGIQAETAARGEHAQGALKMKLGYLQMQLQQAEASKDRDLQKYLQDQINETNLKIAELGAQTPDAGGAGGGVMTPQGAMTQMFGDVYQDATGKPFKIVNGQWVPAKTGPSMAMF